VVEEPSSPSTSLPGSQQLNGAINNGGKAEIRRAIDVGRRRRCR
jgi:hypothetical protein